MSADSLSLTVPTPRVTEPSDDCLTTVGKLVAYERVMTWSGWSPEFTGTTNGSELVAALERAYAQVQRLVPELPDVVMVTGSGEIGGGWLKLGHFGRDRWNDAIAQGRKPEMFIGGELLAMGAVRTMRTLLHEAAHAVAFVRGVDDTSRQGRYHNRKFVAIANELGLDYLHDQPHGTIGFSDVDFTPEGRRQWVDVIADLHQAITLSMGRPMLAGGGPGLPGGPGGMGGHGGRTGRTKGTGGGSTVKVSCPQCNRIGRFSPSQLARGPIFCGSDDHEGETFEML